MNTDKFPEYREKVFEYIQNEILPKYPEIKSCNMHILPSEVNRDIEFIFFIQSQLNDKDLIKLQNSIDKDLFNFCQSFEKVYFLKMFIILKN